MASMASFLVGPTASGKSSVAHYLAERGDRLIVSADSMNLYRGMDIGTAKPAIAERNAVEYVGVDVVDPTEKFSVAGYLEAVRPAFLSDRHPIVAGGTGLYVKCLLEGFDHVAPEDAELRAELEQLSFSELERRVRQEAPKLFSMLSEDDRKNPRRLIRVLERKVCGERRWGSAPRPTIVGLHVERSLLHRRIATRVDEMYVEGLLDEAESLLKLDLSATALQGIGYAEAFAVLRGEMTLEQAKERTVIRTRQLAKRQMTWFRNQLSVHWIDISASNSLPELAQKVADAWEKLGQTPVVLD